MQVLTEHFSFHEDHKLTDTRLGICTLSVAFALLALGYDYLNPFPASKPVLILCVISYPFTTFDIFNNIVCTLNYGSVNNQGRLHKSWINLYPFDK